MWKCDRDMLNFIEQIFESFMQTYLCCEWETKFRWLIFLYIINIDLLVNYVSNQNIKIRALKTQFAIKLNFSTV